MPSKNAVKTYIEDGFYHVYNRGVDKRLIFEDDQDYCVFLNLIKVILTPKDELENSDFIFIKNKAEEIELVSYCLMPNHFHLILKQLKEKSMSEFMKILMTSYVAYFNKKYKRTGALFQGRYKAVLIDRDEYLKYLSRYIHMNPKDLSSKLEDYPYSSYKYYIGGDHPLWLKPLAVLEQFKDIDEYKNFINDLKTDSLIDIKNLTIDA